MRSLLALWLLAAAAPSVHALHGAAGKVDITPDLATHRVYLAGYGARGRKVEGVHDPLYARAAVVSDGKKTVAFVSLDVLGFSRNDVLAVRRKLDWDEEKGLLFLTASHTHSGPDTLGLWGPFVGFSGVDMAYQRLIHERVAELVKELEGRMTEVRLKVGTEKLDPKGLCADRRDPNVVNPYLVAARLETPKGEAVATLVNWSCHAEVIARANRLLTADFPGVMCRELDQDGGTCVFLQGTIGGMLTPEKMLPAYTVPHMYEANERIGKELAGHARRAVKGKPAKRVDAVEFATRTVRVPIENSRFLLFLPSLAFGHQLFDSKGRPMGWLDIQALRLKHALFPIRRHFPLIDTEVSRIRVGDVEVLGIPGEIFPELVIGGFDGEYAYGRPILKPTNPGPPDLSQAPRGPYLRDVMTGPHKMVVGLANDMLGYIIPAYDFKVAKTRSMVPHPKGHHYEETNSVGPSVTMHVLKTARELLEGER